MQKTTLRTQAITWVIRCILFAIALVGAVAFAYYTHSNEYIQNLILSGGYMGMFAFSFINGFNVIVPFVTATLIPALVEAGLSMPVLIAVVTIGVTFADAASFFFGAAAARASRSVESQLLQSIARAKKLSPKMVLPVVFLWATFAPLPNEVLLFPLGFLGYRWYRVLPVVFLGNIMFTTLVSFGVMTIISQLM